MSETIVIVGAGHAAGQAAASLRQKKFAGRIVIIGEEAYIPYQRPPLSKKFLAGELDEEGLEARLAQGRLAHLATDGGYRLEELG